MPKFLAPALTYGESRIVSSDGTVSHRLAATTGLSGQGNLTIGQGAGGSPSTTLSGNNIAIGVSALAAINGNNTDNVAIGYQALQNGTGAYKNIAIGTQALQSYSGAAQTVGIGYQAGKSNTTGTGGVYIGSGAGQSVTTAGAVTCVGWNAGIAATGQNGTYVGCQAGYQVTTGTNNTFVGQQAGAGVTTGVNNTALGLVTGVTLATGSQNVLLGGQADTAAATNFATAIGYLTKAQGDGSVAIGHDNAAGAATTAIANEIKMGTALHTMNVIGNCSLGGSGKTLGFLGATPVVRNAGWTVTAGYTADKIFDPVTTTLPEVAAVLGTLIDALKTYGLLG